EMIYMSYVPYHLILYFFFQAEDGIRDFHVTGVQTCALPISACCECRHRRRQVLSSVSSKARRLAMLVSRSVFESCSSLACCWRAVYTSSLKALRNWRSSFTRSGEENKDRKSTRLNSSHVKISYAVFCLKKKKKTT